jgi:hypothetical protein
LARIDLSPPIWAGPHSWNNRYVPPYPATGWDGVLQTSCLGGFELLSFPSLPFKDYRLEPRATTQNFNFLNSY